MINFATLHAATDPESGLIDMDMINTGRTMSSIIKIKEIEYKIKVMLSANESKFKKAT